MRVLVRGVREELSSGLVVAMSSITGFSNCDVQCIRGVFGRVAKLGVDSCVGGEELARTTLLVGLAGGDVSGVSSRLGFSARRSFAETFGQRFRVSPVGFHRRGCFSYSSFAPDLAGFPCRCTVCAADLNALGLGNRRFAVGRALLGGASSETGSVELGRVAGGLRGGTGICVIAEFLTGDACASRVCLRAFVKYDSDGTACSVGTKSYLTVSFDKV